MSNTITPQQLEKLREIAAEINAEIQAHNNTSKVVHQVIEVSVYSDKESACLDIETYRTHSHQEENLVYNAIMDIGSKLAATDLPTVQIQRTGHSTNGDCFKAYFAIAKPVVTPERAKMKLVSKHNQRKLLALGKKLNQAHDEMSSLWKQAREIIGYDQPWGAFFDVPQCKDYGCKIWDKALERSGNDLKTVFIALAELQCAQWKIDEIQKSLRTN